MASTVKDLLQTATKAAQNQVAAQTATKATAAAIAAARGATGQQTASPAEVPAGGTGVQP